MFRATSPKTYDVNGLSLYWQSVHYPDMLRRMIHRDEAKRAHDQIAPIVRYMDRFVERLEAHGFTEKGEAMWLALNARNALRGLSTQMKNLSRERNSVGYTLFRGTKEPERKHPTK